VGRLVRGALVVASFAVGLGSSVLAQQAPPAAGKQQEPKRVAIKAGRLLDVRTGAVTRDALILVEGDRIASVGAAVPAGVPVIDLSGLTVLPGLIDAHDHILGNPKDWTATSWLRTSAPEAAIWGVRNVQVLLDHGFTGVRDACEAVGSEYG
jgi:imidazolonepropionase-like amidohydrolase